MRALRYSVVGAIAFAIDLGCLILFVRYIPLVAANTLAFLFANAVNFGLAHMWVFQRPWSGSSLAYQYVAVLAVSVVGLVLNDALVWSGVEVLGVHIVAAKVFASAVVMFWNFIARSLWIYREAH